MDSVVIYDDHLQIVADRARHEQLKAVQLATYPTSIIVTPAVLQLYHNDDFSIYIGRIKQVNPDAIWYLLPAGLHGAEEGYHCNGIRYGPEPSDYVSLVRIKSFNQ